ncbi:MAG TPA: FkbM family methyltransferase [Chryseosolibacter sp.]
MIDSYLNFKAPKENAYSLKSGHRLVLSTNPHDSITVMVIFCRQEYGPIPANGVVVDIGANIGMFSLYAAINGARKVYAFEPNRKSFEILCKNIEVNKFTDIIIPFNEGVSDTDGKIIYLPEDSSPYNVATQAMKTDNVPVETVSLTSILNDRVKEKVDLLKIDCEGAEYEILYSTGKQVFDTIGAIRMEHHKRPEKAALLKFLGTQGFALTHEQNMILWLARTGA